MGLLIHQIAVFLAVQLSVSFSWARVLRLPTADEHPLFFQGRLPEITTAAKHDSVVLHCKVGGLEPTIHWLKDGIRIQQGASRDFRNDQTQYEDTGSILGKSFTVSKLFLDCVDEESAGVYTCIGETPLTRITQETNLVVQRHEEQFLDIPEAAAAEFSHRSCLEKRSAGNTAARIFLWTSLRLEVINKAVQLYCRAEGVPSPAVTWFDQSGQEIPQENENYKILENGDLLIKRLIWEQMGQYVCQASNMKGQDSQKIFIYPMATSRTF
uniref:Zwei Ig domain protein zig-4-like n=1 Tax=Crassostrea virginica TaxID=6565 RepID=A0A8B8A6K2_CRAVI|nr:zwei Ig domain protein zig-4-like [Crassostrea virginica]